MEFQIKILSGKEIIPYIHKLAVLRIGIFREYPYLYEGDLSCEERYLRMYSQTEDALLVIALDNQEIVGAIIGLPLTKAMKEITSVFIEKNIPTNSIFYLGDLILLQEYRGKSIGYTMYQQFEEAVKKNKFFDQIAFCEVVRNDTEKPPDYKSLDNFWQRLGYVKHPDLVAHLSWKKIGATKESNHSMVFWLKSF